MVTEPLAVGDFDRVSFSGEGTLVLTQADEQSLTVRIDDNLRHRVESSVREGTLHLGTQGRVRPSEPVRFVLTVRQIAALHVLGSASAEVGDLVTDRLELELSGSSSVRLGAVNAQKLTARLRGETRAEVAGSGRVDEHEVVLSGDNDYSAPRLRSERADVTISGSGRATVWAADRLDVRVSGSGTVEYYGRPQIDQRGSGNVQLRGLGTP